MRSRIHGLVLAGAALWCVAIIAAPVFNLRSIYQFFSAICHQDPLRSWQLSGRSLPVCVRCASIYFGFLLTTVIMPRPNPTVLKIAIGATLVEFLIAYLFWDSPWLRAGTGLALGAAATPFVVAGVEEMVQARRGRWNGVARDPM